MMMTNNFRITISSICLMFEIGFIIYILLFFVFLPVINFILACSLNGESETVHELTNVGLHKEIIVRILVVAYAEIVFFMEMHQVINELKSQTVYLIS